MVATDSESYGLTDDPLLAEVALALNEAGHWAEVVDPEWRVVFVTDPLRAARGFLIETAPSVAG